MHTGICVPGVSGEFITCYDPDLAVQCSTFADKPDGSADSKITFDFFPKKMKLIYFGPHIDTGSRKGIGLIIGIVSS